MKKFSLLMTFIYVSFGLFATDCIPDCKNTTDWTLEVRGAYYQPNSKAIKKIYTQHFIDYQVEAAKRIHSFCELWVGVSWTTKHGHTHTRAGYENFLFKDKTRMYLLPLSLGFKLIYPVMPFVDLYAGAGVNYSFLKIKNFCEERYSYFEVSRAPFKKEIYKSHVGAVFKIGFQYAMSHSTFLDFFADYYMQDFHFSHHQDKTDRYVFKHKLNCSGFKFGLGLGVYF